MKTFNLTCEAVEATLPDYLDETLEPWVRIAIEEHLGECERCAALARELRDITREASSLPALVPEREIWARVAGRIGAPVKASEPVAKSDPRPPTTEAIVWSSAAPLSTTEPFTEPFTESIAKPTTKPITESPISASERPALPIETVLLADELSPPITELLAPSRDLLAPSSEPPLPARPEPVPTAVPVSALPYRREKRWGPAQMGLAAAALVLVTAGTTSLLTVRWLERGRTPDVASGPAEGQASSSKQPAESGARTPSLTRDQIPFGASTPTPLPGQLGSALAVSETSAPQVVRSPEDVVYDKEIKTLQGIVRRQKPQLDNSTVAEIDKNLRTLDAAIAQIRGALQKDPASSLLDEQASRALEMKVELLRRAALLRSST